MLACQCVKNIIDIVSVAQSLSLLFCSLACGISVGSIPDTWLKLLSGQIVNTHVRVEGIGRVRPVLVPTQTDG